MFAVPNNPLSLSASDARSRYAETTMRAVPGDALGIDYARLRPSELRAAYEREIEDLRAAVDTLKGALAANDPARALAEPKEWMARLTRHQRALMGALIARCPRPVAADDLIDILPGHDHVEERTPKQVAVVVHYIRQKLGETVIQNARGHGYFIAKAERDRLLAATA